MNQDSYFLLRGNQNKQIHIQVRNTPVGGYSSGSDTVLKVPVLYEGYRGNYFSYYESDDTAARQRYAVQAITNGIADIGVSMAELIAAGSRYRQASQAASSSGTPQASSSPATESDNSQATIDALRAQIEEANKKIAALMEQKTEETTETTETTKTTTVDETPEATETTSTSSVSGTDSAEKSEFTEKWKKVDIDYKTPCDKYKEAVKNNNTSEVSRLKGDLDKLSNNAIKSIAEINEYLKGSDVSDEEKKIGKAAIEKLKEVTKTVAEALKTQAPKQTTTAEKKEDNSDVVSKYKGVSKYPSTTAAHDLAREADKLFSKHSTDTTFQAGAITAYNQWALAVLDENVPMTDPSGKTVAHKDVSASVYLTEVNEAIKTMSNICTGNKSRDPKVQSALSDSKELLKDLISLKKQLEPKSAKEFEDKDLALATLYGDSIVC